MDQLRIVKGLLASEARKPRPLTESERRDLRIKEGGDASPEMLNDLARRINLVKVRPSVSSVPNNKPSNNGWS